MRAGAGGWQEVDGRDMRENGTALAAVPRNGERQRVRVVVEGTRVGVWWNGEERGESELAGRRLSLPTVWGAGIGAGSGSLAGGA